MRIKALIICGVSINIDSPLGIGDRIYFSYMTVHKKKPDRSWKRATENLKPGEIAPIEVQRVMTQEKTLYHIKEI